MNVRFASLAAAVVLAVASPAASAFAQSYTAPAGNSWTLPRSDDSRRVYPQGEVETTGSVARPGIDSSAKGGNAGQPERSVPQFGNTSGGPAR